MESVITSIISAISPSALPIVVCVLGLGFIYFKIQSQRKVTKTERDTAHDDLDKRLTLVEHDVQFMKQQNSLFADKLDRILDELCSIKIELAKKEDK
jgi:uncharacterized protein HemX